MQPQPPQLLQDGRHSSCVLQSIRFDQEKILWLSYQLEEWSPRSDLNERCVEFQSIFIQDGFRVVFLFVVRQ